MTRLLLAAKRLYVRVDAGIVHWAWLRSFLSPFGARR